MHPPKRRAARKRAGAGGMLFMLARDATEVGAGVSEADPVDIDDGEAAVEDGVDEEEEGGVDVAALNGVTRSTLALFSEPTTRRTLLGMDADPSSSAKYSCVTCSLSLCTTLT